MHSSLTIADYLLDKSKNNKNNDEQLITLTPMQLVKLVYLCHGWMLGLYGRPLLTESVEVWRYGPVVAGLYRTYRTLKGSTSGPVSGPLSEDTGKFDEQEKSVMDQVFKIYGRYTGLELSSLTHAPGTPWRKMHKAGKEIIPNDLIESHFRELSEQG